MQMVIAKTGRICNLLFAKSRCPAKTMGARVFAPGGNVALAEEFQMSGGPRDSNNGCGDGEQTNGRSSSRARAAISCHRCFWWAGKGGQEQQQGVWVGLRVLGNVYDGGGDDPKKRWPDFLFTGPEVFGQRTELLCGDYLHLFKYIIYIDSIMGILMPCQEARILHRIQNVFIHLQHHTMVSFHQLNMYFSLLEMLFA